MTDTTNNPDTLIHRRPSGLSPSRAADYKSCPLKYRFRTIDRIPEPPSAAATRGTLVHAVLEQLYAAPANERTADFATGQTADIWDVMVRKNPDLQTLIHDGGITEWISAANKLVARYFELEDPRYLEPEACEIRLEVTLSEDVPVRGFVDRLDVSPQGLIRIVDYKTGRAPAPAYQSEAIFQLKFYALMMFRLRNIVPARLLLLYLGNGKRLEYTPTEDELITFERSVIALWRTMEKAINTGVFPPRKSRLCDWCSFQDICPEFGGTPPPYPLKTS